jgi:hypothetical protein
MEHYYTGLKLYLLAKQKAEKLHIPTFGKMETLIHMVQEKEGNLPCFRQRDFCNEVDCCWQAACTSQMIRD